MSAPASIGKYRVLTEIGRGGVGVVYLAEDPELGREVAIKVLRGDFDDQDRDRFLRGAQVLSRLRHPNIVAVYEYGHLGGQPFIVMEYIVGESLRTVIDKRLALPLSRKLKIIDDVCAGMAYAHSNQIIHRDLKPENIMLDAESGTARIVDFDLSRSLRTNASRFTQGVGTFHYMAPEQFFGQTDHRSDIFSIGAVSYELLAFARAFEGEAPAAMQKIFAEKPPSLARRCPGIDRGLVRIVHRALAKKPPKRYQTLEQIRADIARVLLSLRPEIVLQTVEPLPRRPRMGRTTAIGALGVGAIAVASLWVVVGAHRTISMPLSGSTGSVASLADASSAGSKAENSAIPPTSTNASAEQRSLQPAAIIESAKPQPFSPLVRDNKAAPGSSGSERLPDVVSNPTVTGAPRFELKQYIPVEGPQYALALSAVPRLLARVADFSTKVRVSELTTGREVRTFDGSAVVLSLSQDGKRLAAVQKYRGRTTRSVLKVWEVSTGQDIQTIDLHDSAVGSLAFSSTGQMIVMTAGAGLIRLVDVSSGLQVKEFDTGLATGSDCLAFSPDDRFVAVAAADGIVQLWDVFSGRLTKTIDGHAQPGTHAESSHVAFSPDGRRLAVGTERVGVSLWALAEGRNSSSVFNQSKGVRAFAFSPDGAWLAVGGEDARVTLWDLANGRVLERLNPTSQLKNPSLERWITSLAFSPDGTLLVAGTASGAQLWQRVP